MFSCYIKVAVVLTICEKLLIVAVDAVDSHFITRLVYTIIVGTSRRERQYA